ncbi:MAG: hypothetical protein D6743_18230, partial [Calditrichaeota bacterium]
GNLAASLGVRVDGWERDWSPVSILEVLTEQWGERLGGVLDLIPSDLDQLASLDARVVLFSSLVPSQLTRTRPEPEDEELETLLVRKALTHPAWEHRDKEVMALREDFVASGDVVTLSAIAEAFDDGVEVTFSIVRVVGGQEEALETLRGRVQDEVATSSPWTVPSVPGEKSAANDVFFRFYATAEGYETETATIPMGKGIMVWLEIDPLASEPENDTLELWNRDEDEQVMTIDVSQSPEAAPGYKKLFLPMAAGKRYDLLRKFGPDDADVDYLLDGMTPEELLALGADPPRIETLFLLNGPLDPGHVRQALEEARRAQSGAQTNYPTLTSDAVTGRRALEIVDSRFFFLGPRPQPEAKKAPARRVSPTGSSTDQLTLVASDEHGRLCCVDQHFHPSRFGLQRPVGYHLLDVEPVAPGMARYAYFLTGDEWKRKLLDAIDDAEFRSGRFKAFPVEIEEDLIKQVGSHRKLFSDTMKLRQREGNVQVEQPPCTRYVFPKVQYIYILLPRHVLSGDLTEQNIPPCKIWKAGEGTRRAVHLAG